MYFHKLILKILLLALGCFRANLPNDQVVGCKLITVTMQNESFYSKSFEMHFPKQAALFKLRLMQSLQNGQSNEEVIDHNSQSKKMPYTLAIAMYVSIGGKVIAYTHS